MRKRLVLTIVIMALMAMCFSATSSFASSGAGKNACKWAVSIANDNAYTATYSVPSCYYCGYNTKAYACTTFVIAAYAHGAGDMEAYDWCWNCRNAIVSDLRGAMKNSPNWINKKKLSKKKLRKGDVLFYKNTHCAIYAGSGKVVDVRSGRSKKNQIAKHKMVKGWTCVMRHR